MEYFGIIAFILIMLMPNPASRTEVKKLENRIKSIECGQKGEKSVMSKLINELVGNKKFQEALVLINEAIKQTPNDKELLKLAGLTYVNLELWTGAKSFFESVVKFEPDDATSWFYLAKCYENGQGVEKDFIKAVEWYTKSAKQGDMDAKSKLNALKTKLN